MTIQWHSRTSIEAAVRIRLHPAPVVLDIGCGIRPQQLVTPLVHVCVDPHEEYVRYLRKLSQHEMPGVFFYHVAGWKEVINQLPEKCVDTVFLLDVIEHVNKNEALELLRRTEAVARGQIVLFTPLGFMEQKHEPHELDAWNLHGAELQEHRSGWFPEEDFDDSWEIHACRDFHEKDHHGEKLAEAVGAFWAIKTLDGPGSEPLLGHIEPSLIAALGAMGANGDPEHDLLALALDRGRHAVELYRDTLKEKDLMFRQYGATLSQLATERYLKARLREQFELIEKQKKTLTEQLNRANHEVAQCRTTRGYRAEQAIRRLLKR
jgi:hypothetical protein